MLLLYIVCQMSNGKYTPEEGQPTSLPESTCDIRELFQNISLECEGLSGLNFFGIICQHLDSYLRSLVILVKLMILVKLVILTNLVILTMSLLWHVGTFLAFLQPQG